MLKSHLAERRLLNVSTAQKKDKCFCAKWFLYVENTTETEEWRIESCRNAPLKSVAAHCLVSLLNVGLTYKKAKLAFLSHREQLSLWKLK